MEAVNGDVHRFDVFVKRPGEREQGRELFMPGVSGQVVANRVLRELETTAVDPARSFDIGDLTTRVDRALSRIERIAPVSDGGGAVSTTTIGDVHFHLTLPVGADPKQIAHAAHAELQRLIKRPRNTALHDGGDYAF